MVKLEEKEKLESVKKELQRLQKYKLIKINDSDKERLVFKNKKEVFEIFGAEAKEVLTPFDDYSYKWLHSFLCSCLDLLEFEDFVNLEDFKDRVEELITEWADSETDVYTSNLTEWLNDRPANSYFIDEAIKEFGAKENIIGVAQFMAIEELFCNACNCLFEYLESEAEQESEEVAEVGLND